MGKTMSIKDKTKDLITKCEKAMKVFLKAHSKAITILLIALFLIYIAIGLELLYVHKPYLSICIEELKVNIKIHIAYCAALAWLSIIVSCIAISKFHDDSSILETTSKEYCDIGSFANIQKAHVVLTSLCMVVISIVAVLLVCRIAVDKYVKSYLIVLAIVYIATMITAYGYAVYLVNKIHVIFSKDFIDYNNDYPISTKIFKKCYHILFHGIVLFWIIGILLLVLITLLCINENVFAMETQFNIFVLIVAYICILFGFLLSTIYPYYITSRKIEELKLASISKYLENEKVPYGQCGNSPDNIDKPSTADDTDYKKIELIINSPNSLQGSSGIRVYSTLTVVVSLITQICSLYLLIKGTYSQ